MQADKSENIHKGHRQRVKKEFLEYGFNENTPHHKILEMLLFFCIPQGDTNPLAHELLNKYNNSIVDVLEAPVEELIKFKGLTESNVVLLKLIMPIARQYSKDETRKIKSFSSYSDIGNFLLNQFSGYTEENLALLCLDGVGHKKGFSIVEKGDIASVGVSTRKIIQTALSSNASCAVLAHNHPSRIALPSSQDIAITKTVAEALSHINVRLIDHIIIAEDDYVSMAQTEKYKYIFNK